MRSRARRKALGFEGLSELDEERLNAYLDAAGRQFARPEPVASEPNKQPKAKRGRRA